MTAGVAYDPAIATRRRRITAVRPIPVVVALIFLFGVYTNIPLRLGGGAQFPALSAIPGLLILLPFVGGRFVSATFFGIVAFTAFVVGLSLVAPFPHLMTGQRLVAGGQMLFSLVLGMTAYWMIQTYSRRAIARFLLVTIIALLVLSAIEVLTPFKRLVQSYMLLYGGEGLTEQVINRDVGTAGAYRPKLFTAETSYVAMALSYGIACYVWTETRTMKYLVGPALLGAAFIIVRSPTVLGALGVIMVIFLSEFLRQRRTRDSTLWLVPLLLLITIVGTIAVGDYVGALIERRLEGAKSGSDYSVTYRTYGSWAAGIAVANQYPLVGVGLGSHTVAADTIIRTELNFGVPESAVMREWRMSLNNAPSNSLVMFGYLGTVLIWSVAFWGFSRLSRGITPVLITLIAILSMSDGAIYSPRYVIYLFVFLGIARLLATRAPAPQPSLRPRTTALAPARG